MDVVSVMFAVWNKDGELVYFRLRMKEVDRCQGYCKSGGIQMGIVRWEPPSGIGYPRLGVLAPGE